MGLDAAVVSTALPSASLANWVSAIGTLAAVIVALWLALSERRRDRTERRAREVAQASLVTVTLPVESNRRMGAITNHSEQPVLQPRVESMGDPPPSMRWPEAGSPSFPPNLDGNDYTEVLPSKETYRLIFDYSTRGIQKPVHVKDVTITFTNASGRWRRTGNGEPVRVI